MSIVAAPPDLAADLPAGFMAAVGATPERQSQVAIFANLLARANQHMNLVGASTLDQFWRRHFLDSAQLLWFAPAALTWADLGAGAGLPGIILAILLKGRPGARVDLVESMAKRCRFLAEAAAALDLPVEIHNVRAESLGLPVEVVTARACAPLTKLLDFAKPSMDRGARGLFLKGQDAEAEMAAARKTWRFAARVQTSLSDPRGRVLSLTELARVHPR
jgi:16S rRNA (guanine527-N7)-methyltransferase